MRLGSTMKLSTRVLASALSLTAPLLVPDSAHANPRKSNTQLPLPRHISIGDIDGDGLQDMVQFAGNRIFAYRTNYTRDGILHGYLDSEVRQLVLGDFETQSTTKRREEICAVHKDNTFRCYGASPNKRELWWWFTQPNFISNDEQAIVGDFDGDGNDDIMTYNPSNGAIELWARQPGAFEFRPLKDFTLGNLGKIDRKNKVLLAGEFGQNAGRDDLLVWDKSAGRIYRYDSVTDKSGKRTFWWAFTTKTGFVKSGQTVRVANLTGGTHDGVVLTDGKGGYQFFQAKYDNGRLAPQTGLDLGNLPNHKGMDAYFGRFAHWSNEPGTDRDDVLLYNRSTNQLARLDARWDANKKRKTYWWAYTHAAPDNDTGWPAMRTDKWRALKCKLEGESTAMPDTYYAELMTKQGNGKYGMFDFMRDSSYGMINLETDIPNGTRTIPIRLGSEDAKSRAKVNEACRKAWDVSLTGYRGLVVFVNGATDLGASGDRRVTLTNTRNDQNVTAHEMLHIYGLPHSFDDSNYQNADWAAVGEYHDGWDVMGSEPFRGYQGAFGKTGTDLHAYNKKRLGWLPAHRIGVLEPGSVKKTETLTLAFVNRPESNGYLLVEIEIADGWRLLLEARESYGLDRDIGKTGVFIRRTMEHPHPNDTSEVTELQTDGGGAVRQPGTTWSGFGVTVEVKNIDSFKGVATVEVTY